MRQKPESWATAPGVAKSMRSNKRRDTAPELAVRRILHAQGFRYRVDFAPDPTAPRKRADIVFTKTRLAVFIDGCFWHGCPTHATMPTKNRDYWEPKLLRNRERDQQTTVALEALGWRVVRIWEHVPAEAAAEVIAIELGKLGPRRGRDRHSDERTT